MQESFADGLAQAAPASGSQFQAANAVCTAFIQAMDEREKAIATWQAAAAVHGPSDVGAHRLGDPTRKELRREGHEEWNRKQQAAQGDNFLSTATKTLWIQRAAVLRQNIQQLYARERGAERVSVQANAATAPIPAHTP